MNVTCFLFDMDGTLVNSDKVVCRALELWAHKTKTNLSGIIDQIKGRRLEDFISELRPDLDLGEELSWFEHQEAASASDFEIVHGGLEFIGHIHPDDWGIVTSANRATAEFRLKAVGLPIPKILITSEDVQIGKPDPAGYRLGLELLGKTSDEVVIFEDSFAGLQAAIEVTDHVVGIAGDLALLNEQYVRYVSDYKQITLSQPALRNYMLKF